MDEPEAGNEPTKSPAVNFASEIATTARTARVWLIMYGVGFPAFVLTQDHLFTRLESSDKLLPFIVFFASGIWLQLFILMFEKWRFDVMRTETARTGADNESKLSRACEWTCAYIKSTNSTYQNVMGLVLYDILTLSFFAIGTAFMFWTLVVTKTPILEATTQPSILP